MKKEVTLMHVGYKFYGESELLMWGGGTGTIEMNPFIILDGHVTKNNIISNINDNGFGCEKILTAFIAVYDLYEGGYEEFNRTLDFDLTNNIKTKKGI